MLTIPSNVESSNLKASFSIENFMISEDRDSIHAVDELLRKIRIKESQLKIAQESQMPYTSEALSKQISDLKRNLSESQDAETQALMSLLTLTAL